MMNKQYALFVACNNADKDQQAFLWPVKMVISGTDAELSEI